MEKEKPSLDQVIKYATPLIKKFIGECATNLPEEQREEILQDAYLRIVTAYKELDPDKGWKSFVWNHSRGAVFDYLKFGKGFHEQRWSIQKEESHGSQNVNKIKDRIQVVNSEDEDQSIDQTLGQHGIFSSFDSEININWDLVARMASIDDALHAFAMHLLDFSQEEIAPKFAACRTSVGGLIQSFVQRFDDPELNDCEWFKQTCRAFGIADKMGIDGDMHSNKNIMGIAVGWSLKPVDLYSTKPLYADEVQMNFFGDDDAEGVQ
jgi:RNA polymerase sigma factor (sigma-70 family)